MANNDTNNTGFVKDDLIGKKKTIRFMRNYRNAHYKEGSPEYEATTNLIQVVQKMIPTLAKEDYNICDSQDDIGNSEEN